MYESSIINHEETIRAINIDYGELLATNEFQS